MSLLKDIVNHLREIKQRLNLIEVNAKTNEELDLQEPLNIKSLIRVSFQSKSESITIEKLYSGFNGVIESGSFTVVFINSKPFRLVKHPQNQQKNLEPNDAIVDGWWSNTEFWDSAVYKGGDVNIRDNWTQLSTHEEIPLI